LFLNLKSLNPIARIKELMRRLRQSEEQLDQVRREKQGLEDEIARLREEITRLQKELETPGGLPGVRPLRFREASGRIDRNPQVGRQANSTASITVGQSRIT